MACGDIRSADGELCCKTAGWRIELNIGYLRAHRRPGRDNRRREAGHVDVAFGWRTGGQQRRAQRHHHCLLGQGRAAAFQYGALGARYRTPGNAEIARDGRQLRRLDNNLVAWRGCGAQIAVHRVAQRIEQVGQAHDATGECAVRTQAGRLGVGGAIAQACGQQQG